MTNDPMAGKRFDGVDKPEDVRTVFDGTKPIASYDFDAGAACAFGLMGMAMAIAESEDARMFDAWQAECDQRDAEIEAKYNEALKRDRMMMRYYRD